MDILIALLFKYIDTFNENQLKELDRFLNFEDEIILDYYHNDIVKEKIDKNIISKYLKILNYDGGEGGIEPTNELPRCWFSRPVLSTAQPPLLERKN